MRLALFDPNIRKFTTGMIESWEKDGHEVRHVPYYDPAMVEWADVIWFETCDNNLSVATNIGEKGWKLNEIDMTGKKVIVRVIDIEAWCGLHRLVDWTYVDEVIFLAPHIKELVEKDVTIKKSQVIPCGVEMDKFPIKKEMITLAGGRSIAWVAERWYAKGIDYFLQFAATLKKRVPIATPHIYCVGIWADNARDGWYRAYIDYFIEQNGLDDFVVFIDRVDDMNEFLEDKSHAICFSKKETFSYAIAEGMCKGLKPIIHNFYGCDKVWPDKYVWNTIDEAIEMLMASDYNPQEYRDYIQDNYSHEIMMTEFNKIIKGEV